MGKAFEKTIKGRAAPVLVAPKPVQQTFPPAPINFLSVPVPTRNIYNNTVITVSSLNSKVACQSTNWLCMSREAFRMFSSALTDLLSG
jgi:hypothetical protein